MKKKLTIRGSKIAALTGLLVLLVSGGAMAAGGSVNWSSGVAPSNYTQSATAHIDVHHMAWGTQPSDALKYLNNNGKVVSLNREVNGSASNPYSVYATSINASDFRAFPHAQKNVSAVSDTSRWSSAGNMTVSSTTTAPNVQAVKFSSSGSGTATFSNVSITSSAQRRYLQAVLDVQSISAGTTVQIRAVDADGDYKQAQINTSMASGKNLIANASGRGIIYQQQLGKLATKGSGDGTFSQIQKVEIRVTGGSATVAVSGLNLDKMSPWTFGDHVAANGTKQTVTNKQTAGRLQLASLSSMGSTFGSAMLHNFEVQTWQRGRDLPSSDVSMNLTKTGNKYPGYYGTATISMRTSMTSAYALSWSNAKITDKQTFPTDRLLSMKYAEATGAKSFGNISSGAWTDLSSKYTGQGAKVSVDQTQQTGQNDVGQFRLRLTKSEYQSLQAQQGGAMGGGGSQAGGLMSIFSGVKGAVLGSLVVLLGLVGIAVKWG